MKRVVSLVVLRSLAVLAVAALPARAALVTYTADAFTTYLFHLDEAAGSSLAVNAGSAGYNALAYDGNPYAGDGVEQTIVTTVLGSMGYTGFGNCANISATDLALGVDYSGNGGLQLDDSAPVSNDRQPDHSTIFGTGNAFTLDAMINLPAITGINREIIATDNSAANDLRGFQFRVNTTGNLEFNFIGVLTSAISAPIPTSGDHAFVANQWFHAGVSYDGAAATFFWTRVDPAFTSANQIGGPTAEGVDVNDDAMLVLGNEGRVVGTTGSTEGMVGYLDEVRISNVARGAGDFIFIVPEPSTLMLGVLAAAGFLLRRRRE